jgi:DNA repair ATPase RecN
MPAELEALEKQITEADTAAELSELTAQILVNVATNTGNSANSLGTANTTLGELRDHLGEANRKQDTANTTLGEVRNHLGEANNLKREANRHAQRAATALERIDEKLHFLHERGQGFESLRIQIDEHHRRIEAIAALVGHLQGRLVGDEAAGGLVSAVTQDQMGELNAVVEQLNQRVTDLLAQGLPKGNTEPNENPPPPSKPRNRPR